MSHLPGLVFVVASVGIAGAQAPLFDLSGSTFNEFFGAGACALNDVDGDLIPDFAVSSSAGGAPTVAVRSGFDGHERWSVSLPFGSGGTIVSPGDVNGDGASDIAAAGRPSASVAEYGIYVLSGLDGSVLWTFFRGFIESHEAIDAGRDYDGDGVGDVVLASRGGWSNLRATHVLSGATGAELVNIFQGTLGTFAVETLIGDVGGDGADDLLTGKSFGAGAVQIRSGVSATVVRTHLGAANEHLGTAVVALSDVNGDGVADYAVGAVPSGNPGFPPFFPPTPAPPAFIRVYSGATGAELYTVSATVAAGAGGPMTALADLDSDGVRDFAATQFDLNVGLQHRSYLSGATGALLQSTVVASFDPPRLVAGVDWNLDGHDDAFLLEPGDDAVTTNAGRLRLISLVALPPALAADLGGACGALGGPVLVVTPPVLGGVATWSCAGAPPFAYGNVALDFAPPVATALGSGCVFHLDLAHAASWLLVPVGTDAAGSFAFPVGVPSIPLLAGAPITLQVFLFGTAGPLGFDLSNGVATTLGF